MDDGGAVDGSGGMLSTAAHRVTVTVRPNDLDALGHVNHAVAIEYLEAGRFAWRDAAGIAPTPGVIPVVTRVDVHYQREIGLGQVDVVTRLFEAYDPDGENYRVRFEQSVEQNGQVVVTAKVHVGFLDAATRGLTTVQHYALGRPP